MNKKPPFLQKGDVVHIISPASPLDSMYVAGAIECLTSWGLRVTLGDSLTASYGVFAGTDAQRFHDLQEALNTTEIRAIFCARGGYGSIRIIEHLDFTEFIKSPKWIVGFSDITALHARVNKEGFASIHAAMPKNFSTVDSDSMNSLYAMLFGLSNGLLESTSTYNKPGIATGTLVGGNLSMLYSMRAIPFEFSYANTLLCIEDLNEYRYHIDRMMQNLKISGVLSSLSGLIVGEMLNMKQGSDPHILEVEEIIIDAVQEYSFPVCFAMPFGHGSKNHALCIGAQYSLVVDSNSASLQCEQDLS